MNEEILSYLEDKLKEIKKFELKESSEIKELENIHIKILLKLLEYELYKVII